MQSSSKTANSRLPAIEIHSRKESIKRSPKHMPKEKALSQSGQNRSALKIIKDPCKTALSQDRAALFLFCSNRIHVLFCAVPPPEEGAQQQKDADAVVQRRAPESVKFAIRPQPDSFSAIASTASATREISTLWHTD